MGTMKMATFVAERSLLLFCLLAFIIPAKALKCHSCLGNEKECKLTEVACPASNYTCGSSTTIVKSFPLKEYTVAKGCVSSTVPHQKISISPSAIVKMSFEEKTCNTDLCNKETIPESEESKENTRSCYSCISSGNDCTSENMRNMNCRGQQTTCLDIRVIGNFGELSDTQLKGCGEVNCSNTLTFSNSRSTVLMKCCNENFCNSYAEFKAPDKKPNGVQCISCDSLNDLPCSSSNYTTTECFGDQTACYEMAGLKMKNGKPTPAVLKGCASPNMCDNSVLPLLQNMKGTRVHCCNGNTCNNNFNKENLQASNFFPGTGTKSDPMLQPSYYEQNSVKRPPKLYNPVKTGHAFNNYGPGSTFVSTSNNYDNNNGDGMDYGELNTLSFAVIDVPSLPPLTLGGHQNNLNHGSWNSDNNGGDSTLTSVSSNGLSGSNLGSIGDAPPTTVKVQKTPVYNSDSYTDVELSTDNDFLLVGSYIENDYITEDDDNQSPDSLDINSYGGEPSVTSLSSDGLNGAPSGPLPTEIPQTTVNSKVQNQTPVYNSDSYTDVELSTDNDFLLVGSYIESEIDYITEDDTSQGPTQSPDSGDTNSYGSEPNVTSLTSGGLNSAPSGPLSTEIPQSTVNGSLIQQNLNSANNSDLYSPTDEEVFIDVSETDTFYIVDTEDDESNLTTTSQGPTQTEDSWDNNSSESSYGLNSDSFASSNSDLTTQILQETTNDDILQQDQTQIYNSGVIITIETLTDDNDNDTTGNYSDNSLSREPQDPLEDGTLLSNNSSNSNIGSVPYILNSSSGGYAGNVANKNNPNKTSSSYNCSSFTANAFNNLGQKPGVNNNGSNNVTNSSSSNLLVPSTGGSYYGSSSSNHSTLGSHQNGTSNGSHPMSTDNVHSYGNGSHWGNSGDHNLPIMPPDGYNGSSGYNSSFHGSEYSYVGPSQPNSTSGSGYLDNSNTKPNSTENGTYHGSGTSRSNSSTTNNGFSNLMPSEVNNNGSNNGTNTNSSTPSMTEGNYNESPSSNHSTLGSNHNYSFVETSNGSNPMSTGNFHSYGNGSDWGNSSNHNVPIMPHNGYNGSSSYNSSFNGSGYSNVGPNHPNSTSGSGYLDNSNTKPNSTENMPYLGSGTSHSNSSTDNNGFSNLMPSEVNNSGSNNGTNTSSGNPSMTGGSYNESSSSNHHTLGSNYNGSFVENSNVSNPMSTGNVHSYGNHSGSSNSSVHNPHMLPPGGYNGSSGYNSNGSFVGNYNGSDSMATGNVHSYGNGSDSSNSSLYTPDMMPPGGYDSNSTPDLIVGGGYINPNMMPPGGNNYGTDGNSHSNYYIPVEGASYGNHNSPGSPYWNYDPNMLPPEVNGPPMEYFNGNGNGNNYNIFGTEGNPNENNDMLLGGSSHGESNDNASHSGSAYPNMPPPAVPGHYGNLGNFMPNINGSNSYQLPPGLNLSTNGNLSNFINIISNATGVSRTVLSERLNGTDLSNPGNMVAVLSSIPGFDHNRLPPELKAIFGNAYFNSPGFHSSGSPPKWNISSFGGRDNLMNALSTAAGISPAILSQKFNGVDINNPSNVASVLASIPGFNANRLPPELKAALFGNRYSNSPGFNSGMSPPKWDISSFGGRDKFIHTLSTAAGISPDLLIPKLNGVDINDPSKVASVLFGIPSFDANKLPSELKAAFVGYTGNAHPNTAGYNNNGMHVPNWNISNLVNNSYFLDALSNMTNISVDVLSQKFNDLNKDGQSNMTALMFSLPGFDPYRLPPEFQKELFGNGTDNNMMPPGSIGHAGNALGNGNNHPDLNLSGKTTNDTASDNSSITFYSGAHSLKSKAGVLALVFTIILLY